jgi:hypothetical protein
VEEKAVAREVAARSRLRLRVRRRR